MPVADNKMYLARLPDLVAPEYPCRIPRVAGGPIWVGQAIKHHRPNAGTWCIHPPLSGGDDATEWTNTSCLADKYYIFRRCSVRVNSCSSCRIITLQLAVLGIRRSSPAK